MSSVIKEEVDQAVVRAKGVFKRYGDFEALKNVSFEVGPGSIVGLIGPNGAGKTSTLKSILGLGSFDGELSVLGVDPRAGRHELMKRVCFVADVGVLPRWLKVRQAIDYVEGVHPNFQREKVEQLLADTDIPLNKKIGQLSKGMITQLHLAMVMSIDVDLLVLDEPTLGLDILYRKTFYDRLLNDYFDHSRSIIISTHQVEEIEPLLTHLLFIGAGEIVLDCSMDELADRYIEVLVNPDNIAKAEQLNPIYAQAMLGKQRMIFEDADRKELEQLGELHAPSVSDLFVAMMSE